MLKNRISWRKKSALSALIAGAFIWQTPQATAATLYWDVNGSTAAFSTVVGAWDGVNAFFNTDATGGAGGSTAAVVGSANDLIIPQATTNTGTITTSGTQSASSITFAPNVGPTTTIAGTAITIGGTGTSSGIFQQSSGANTITAGLTLNSANTAFDFSNSSTGLLTIGAVTGSATTGTQTINIGSSNTGGITHNGIIGNGGAGGNVGLTINNTGAGVTTLSGANTYTGPVAITQGQATVSHITGLGSITATTNLTLGSAGALGTLNYTGGATSSTRPIVIGGAGGGRIDSTSGLLTLTGTVSLASGPLTIGGANNVTIGSGTAAVAQVLGTNALTKTGAGNLTLSTLTAISPIQSVMPIDLQAGTLTVQTSAVGTTNNPLGTGALTITPGATLTFLSGGHVWNLGNAITIANTTATANISGTGNLNVGTTAANTIQFAAGVNTPILRFSNPSTGSPFTTQAFSTITGTGNVELNGTAAGFITISGPQNQAGTIRNVGTSTNVATLSGTIGSGITAISQAGSSPFTVSSAVPLSPTLNTFTSTGSGLWTFSNANTFTGTQSLTFSANSTGAISVSGTTLNHTGTITNSGSTAAISGTTTISSALGGNVGNVIQNSATSPLVLSGANTTAYLGTFTATTGVLQFSNTGAIAGYTGTPNANVRISVANGGILGFAYPAVAGTDITGLVNNANGGGYSNVTFAATGASIGLDTTAGSTSFTNVLANPTGSALGLVKLGTNILTLGTANTYTGRTWVQNGTLSVGTVGNVATPVASSLGMPANATDGAISLGFFTNAGALTYTGAGETSDRNIALAGTTGGATITNSGAGTLTLGGLTSTGVGAKTLTVSGASNTTFGAAVAGGGVGSTAPLTISKAGTGTLLLGAPGSTINTNTVTQLNISGGIVDIGTSGLTISNSGATVIDSTANATINATGGGTLTLSSAAGVNAGDIRPAAGTTLTINANISTPVTNTGFWTAQSGGLELNNSGTLVLTGNNTIAGVTSFTAAGTISVGSIAQNLGGTTGLLFTTAGSRFLYTGTGESTAVPLQPNVNSTVEQAGPSGTLNFTANWVTGAAVKTVTLQGSTAGIGQMSGIISNNGTNTTAITKAGTGTWRLTGANTYTGATTVNGGNLILTTGTTNNSAVTVNNGGTLSALGDYTIGNAGTAAAGGRLTVTAGGILDLQDGAINTLTLSQGTTAGGAALTLSGGTLKFDIGATGDQISITNPTNATAASTGTNFIVINGLAGIANGNYTLINAPGTAGGLTPANFALASNTINVAGTPYSLSLSGTGTTEVLTVSAFAASDPAQAYWNGTTNSSWAHQPGGAGTATNWVAAASGAPDTFSLPGSTSNVFMTSNTVGVGGLTTTIDSVSAVNSLNFTGTGSSNTAGSTINAGTGTSLTINAAAVNGNTVGNGMTIAAGSGANIINVPVVLGANQTWTNNATTVTTVSGVISGAGVNLTKAGTGPMTLSGSTSNTYTGLTTVVNSGTVLGTAGLTLAKTGGAIAIAGNLTIGNATANQFGVVYLGGNEQISPTATITFTGVNSGWGFLEMQGRTQTIGNVVETTPGFGVIETRGSASGTFGTSNAIFNVASGTQSYQGYFRDVGAGLDATNSLKMTKTGTGTLQWGAATGTGAAGTSATARNYSGGTDIQNGTLLLTAPNTAGNSISIVGAGNVSLNGGATFAGTLDLNGLNAGITGLDGTTGTVLGQVVNNVNASTATLTIGNNNNSGSYAGLLLNNNNAGTGILGITKIGTGTQTLSGANAYTGTTTITGGVLRITNSSGLGTVAGGTTQSGTSALELDGSLGAITVGAEALSINGGGISNGGALRNIAGNNTYGGAITLAAQSRINSDSGTLTLNNTAAITATNQTLVVGGAGNITISGATALGTGGVGKDGIGTLTLGGTNTYTGTTTVSNGRVNVTGSVVGTVGGGNVIVGDTAGNNAVLNIGGNMTFNRLNVGTIANAAGAVNLSAGTVTAGADNELTFTFGAGGTTGGYGYFNMTGGAVNTSRFQFGGQNVTAQNGVGVGVLSGGTVTATSHVILARFGNTPGTIGSLTVATGGTLVHTTANGINMGWQGAGRAELSVTGGTITNNGFNVNYGGGGATWTGTGILNLNAGSLTTNTITTQGTGATSYLNFNGGTLRGVNTQATFIPTTVTGAYVNGPFGTFSGGAVIDTNGAANTITIPTALIAPTGNGVTTIPVTTEGSGYIGAPYVSITDGGSGFGATAIANMVDDGSGNGTLKIASITITNPGNNYTAPVISLVGGGNGATAATFGALTTSSNTSGGLTKTGLGTLALSGTNTFTGSVNINNGVLAVGTVTNGGVAGTLGQSTNAASNLLLGSTTAGNGILQYTGTVAGTTDRSFTLNNIHGGFNASGTTLGTFTLTAPTMSAASGLGAATLTLNGTGAGATGQGSIATLIADGTGTTVGLAKSGTGTWNVTNVASSYTGPTVITQGILGVTKLSAGGANSSIGASTNAAANLVLQGGTLQYTGTGDTTDRNYTFGNATTATGGGFDTTGATGPLVISGNMTGANAAAGTQVLTLTSSTAAGTLSGNIVDSSVTALTGVTKTGVGAWTLAGANTYSGATTISAGTLQFAGSSSLNSTTQIGIAAGSTLQIRDNAAGTINHTTNNITASSAGTITIDVGNNGGATTNSTVAFGALNNGTAANALATTFNFIGANGYTQSFSSLALPGTTGNNTTLNPTTTSVTIAGPVTNQMVGFSTANFDTLFLGGTSSGNAITGVISDAATASPTANGLTLITKQGTSTWTLSGANTYRGATTINGGTLIIPNSSSVLANTAIAVNPTVTGPNPTFAVTPGTGIINLGNTSDTTRGATLTLNPGTASNPLASAFTMQDNAVGVVNLVQGATFAGNALTLGGATAVGYVMPSLSFDIGGTSLTDIDVFNVTKQATVGSGGVVLNFAALTTSTSLATGDYTFLNAGAGSTLLGGALTLGTSTIAVGPTTYSLSLANSTATSGILTVTALAGNASAFWKGDINGSWNSFPGGTDTNFATSLSGTTDIGALPDLNSNVTFTTAVASNLSTTLDANFTINSLNFNGTGTSNAAGSTIASGVGSNTLTINALAVNGNTLGNGISVGTGSGPNTISAPVALGSSQSWTVASGTSLNVSGDVSGTGFALTLPGNGTVTLSGNNSYSLGTNLNAGTLNINSATAIGTGPLTVINATIDNTTVSPITLSTNNTQNWVNNGALAFTGTRALNLGTGAVTLGADATAGAFTITNNSALAGTSLTVGGPISAVAGGTAGAKTITIAGTGNTALTGNLTPGSAASINVTVTAPGTTTLSGNSTIRNLNVNGGASSIVDIGAGNLTINAACAASINSTTGGTVNATGGGVITIGGNSDDYGTANGTLLTINAKFSGVVGNTWENFYSGSTTGVTFLANNANDFLGPVLLNTAFTRVSTIGNSGSPSGFGAGTTITLNGGSISYVGSGATTNRVLNLGNSGTIDLTGSTTTSGSPLNFTANLTATGTNVKTLTLSGDSSFGEISGIILNNSVTNTTGVTKAGTGLWNLSGANTYTGATTVNGGILRLSGTLAATPINVNTGGTLQVGTATAMTSINNVTLAGTGTLDLFGNSVSIGSLTSAATNLITNSSSNVTASTATAIGTPTGPGVFVDALTITTAGPTAAALITDGPTRKTQIVLNNALTNTAFSGFTNGALSTFSGGLVLANNATGTRLNILAAFTGTPFGTGPIIVGQAATDKAHILISTTATLSNPVISNTTLGTDRVGTYRIEGGTATLSGTQTANLAPMAISTNGVGVANITGRITGPNGFQLLGNPLGGTSLVVTLTNTGTPNDYQGDTVVNFNPQTKPYTLRLGAANQIPNGSTTGNVILNTNAAGIATFDLNTFSETINGLTGNAGSIVDTIAGGTPTLTLGDNNATGLTFSGIIRNTAGTLALTKIGTGTQTLSGNLSSFTGNVIISDGTLLVGAGVNGLNPATSPLGNPQTAARTITIASGKTLNFGGNDVLGNSVSTPVVTLVNNGGTITNNGNFFSTLGAVQLNGGTLSSIGGVNVNFQSFTLNGTITVGGTAVSTISSTGTNSAIQLRTAGTTFDVADAVSGSGSDLNVPAVLANPNASTGALIKTGVGTMTLTGVNTYTGPTNVTGGTLIVGVGGVGSTANSSSTTVAAGATLGGSGTIGGVTTVSGIVAPGNSIGTLTANNNVTWNASSGNNWVWELGTAGASIASPGTSDLLNITSGDFLKGTGSGFAFDFSGNGAAGVYKLVDWTGTTNFVAGDFAATNFAGGLTSSFTVDSGTSALYLTLANAITTTGTTYTLAAAPTTLNILQGGSLAGSVTVQNTGTGTADSLTFTNLTGSSGTPSVATATGTLSGGTLAPGASAVQNLTINGIANGNSTITSQVASATNTTLATPATFSPPAGTINVVVGNASYAGGNSSAGPGPALSAATPISVTPYTGLASNTISQVATGPGTPPPAIGTTATLLHYTNSTGTDSGVSMAWRTRTAAEASSGVPGDNGTTAVGYLISDVVSLTGMVNGTGVNATNPLRQTDIFVLQMSYDQNKLGVDMVSAQNHENAGAPLGRIYLAWNDTGNWTNAVNGNIGGTNEFVFRGYQAGDELVLGRWGVDIGNNVAWAVLNHNSEFAVIPEPSTLVLGGLALLGFAGVGLRKRRLAK